MTTIGNNLTVDGTVTASQATQAGEAVVLGSDGTVPSSLLPSTGGGSAPIHFMASTPLKTYSGMYGSLTSTTLTTNILNQEVPYGPDSIVNRIIRMSMSPGLGIVVLTPYSMRRLSGTCYVGSVKPEYQNNLLTACLRTDLRGTFDIGLRVLIFTGNSGLQYYSCPCLYDPDIVNVTISDEGITVNSGSMSVVSNSQYPYSVTFNEMEVLVESVSLPDDQGWSS